MKGLSCAALALALLPACASAQQPPASNNLGQQNAVANQQSANQLSSSLLSTPAPALMPGQQTIGNGVAMAAHNATNNQQEAYVTDQASTTIGVAEQLTPLPPPQPAPAAMPLDPGL